MDAPISSPWLGLKQVAARLPNSRSPRFVAREIKAGRLRAARIGGRGEYVVRDSWVDEYIESLAQPVTLPNEASGVKERLAEATARQSFCGPRVIKRVRRTKVEIETIEAAIYMLLANDHPQTLRGLFYQAVSHGFVEKTQQAYKSVGRLCVRMRKAGELPYDWLADSMRWMRKPQSYSSFLEMLETTRRTYRRALWANQPVYKEIWCEKDALAGLLYEETAPWDVSLMVTRGYPSLSYLYEAANAIKAQNKPVFLYYFGDHDPSGVDIPRQVEQAIREYATNVDLTFQRMAVTPEQIRDLKLPTRPTKRSDTRSRGFAEESVEVDAIPARVLRAIVRSCLESHVDAHALEMTKVAEENERELLLGFTREYQQFEYEGRPS